MEALVITWRELLIVLVAVVGVCVAELALLLRWSGNRGIKLWRRAAPGNPEGQRTSVSQEITDLRRQVARLETEVEKLKAATVAGVSPYNQAIQMARQGASAAEVASSCGISRGEAELIVALYRKLRT